MAFSIVPDSIVVAEDVSGDSYSLCELFFRVDVAFFLFPYFASRELKEATARECRTSKLRSFLLGFKTMTDKLEQWALE